jgi:hypothetical protein
MCKLALIYTMITDIQLKFLQDLLDGKIKKKDCPKKYSGYMKRIREQIDHALENLLWLAENRPDILQDLDKELLNEDLPMKRRARALIKAVSLFENEPNVFAIIAEVYSKHSIELQKKKNVDSPC